jgi:ATP-dependent Clp protease ATP-binding subunit ClpA
MSDRREFTDRATRVLALANQQAQAWCHEYIGTEHILVAVSQEASGVGAHILMNFGANPKEIFDAVGAIVERGPDMVTVGKLPQTQRAKRAIEYADANAKDMGHDFVGTEHILLGLLDTKASIAYRVMETFGLTKANALEFIDVLINGDKSNCCDCDKFEICAFAKSINESNPYMLEALFGDLALSVCEEVFKFFGGRCKIFERKSE